MSGIESSLEREKYGKMMMLQILFLKLMSSFCGK